MSESNRSDLIVREYIRKNVRYWFIVKKDSRRKYLGPFFSKEEALARLEKE